MRAASLLVLLSLACAQGASGPDGGAEGLDAQHPFDGGAGAGPDCSGVFGPPELVIEFDGNKLGPAVTGDELELYYAETVSGVGTRFMRSVRSSRSEPFLPGSPVDELTALCANESSTLYTLDLSHDGLRAYVTCGPIGSPNPVYFAERADRSSPFQARGTRGQAGTSVVVDPTELTLYSSGLDRGVPLMATRASLDEPFGVLSEVPGFSGRVLLSPDISPDGLALYGAQSNRLGVATRPSTSLPFDVFAELEQGSLTAAGAPEISADCRTLYFLGVGYRVTDGGSVLTHGIYALRR